MDIPQTRYVSVGEAAVAYQVVGDGDIDLAYCQGLGSHVELIWDTPNAQTLVNDPPGFSRLIFFDRRGTGASDAVTVSAMLAVHIAARIGALAGPDEVLISGTVKDLISTSNLETSERGSYELKGVPGTTAVFVVR